MGNKPKIELTRLGVNLTISKHGEITDVSNTEVKYGKGMNEVVFEIDSDHTASLIISDEALYKLREHETYGWVNGKGEWFHKPHLKTGHGRKGFYRGYEVYNKDGSVSFHEEKISRYYPYRKQESAE